MFQTEDLIPIFGIIFTFGIPGLIILSYIYIKHRERMRLIEKGLTPDEIKNYFSSEKIKSKTGGMYSSLKWGLLFIFIGLGIILASILSEIYEYGDDVSFGIVIMFAGIGFMLYYFIVKNKLSTPLLANSNEFKTKED